MGQGLLPKAVCRFCFLRADKHISIMHMNRFVNQMVWNKTRDAFASKKWISLDYTTLYMSRSVNHADNSFILASLNQTD